MFVNPVTPSIDDRVCHNRAGPIVAWIAWKSSGPVGRAGEFAARDTWFRQPGIVHPSAREERDRQGQRLFGIQTWMALPAEQEADPASVHHGAEALPTVDGKGVRARLIPGRAFGAASPLAAASETLYADVHPPLRLRQKKRKQIEEIFGSPSAVV